MTLEDVAGALRAYPGFIPGLILLGAGGLVLNRPIRARLGVSSAMAAGLALSVGLILAATLMPGGDPPHTGATCDLSRMGLAPLAAILSIGAVSLNIALFVPLGVVVGLQARSRTKLLVLIAAVALPFLIESAQLLVTPLERKCQSADVFDNLTGLALGVAGGALAGWLARRTKEPPVFR